MLRNVVKRFSLLVTILAVAAPAYAKTGNFLPQLASIFIVIPALLLAPAIAIALDRDRIRKRYWIIASLALAVLAFASLWWALRTFSLAAGDSWPVIYLWVVPSVLLWLVYRRMR